MLLSKATYNTCTQPCGYKPYTIILGAMKVKHEPLHQAGVEALTGLVAIVILSSTVMVAVEMKAI